MRESLKSKSDKSASPDFWLMSNDELVTSAVWNEIGFKFSGQRCRSLRELGYALEDNPAPIAIVDIDPSASPLLARLERIIGRFASTRFIALSEDASSQRIIEAMEAGVRQYVVKSAIASDLAAVVRKFTEAQVVHGGLKAGHVVTVLSAGGGCGSTTLAVNLTNAFSHMLHTPALVADFDAQYGTVATYLGLSGQFSVSHLLNRNFEETDAQLVRTTALMHTRGLHALISPASVNFNHPEKMEMSHLEAALNACRGAYARTVIDAPRIPMELAAQLACESCTTLIMMQLTVKDVRMARSIRDGLIEMGASPHNIRFVVGRYTGRGDVSLAAARSTLESRSIFTISNDYASACKAINFGQTLATNTALYRDIHKLARSINGELPAVDPTVFSFLRDVASETEASRTTGIGSRLIRIFRPRPANESVA